MAAQSIEWKSFFIIPSIANHSPANLKRKRFYCIKPSPMAQGEGLRNKASVGEKSLETFRELGIPHFGRWSLTPRSYHPLERRTIDTTDSITGTSTSTPTTVASAAPD